MKKTSVSSIKKSKNSTKLTMITAYDALFASIFEGEVDMILVGDSLNMSFGGEEDTLSIDMEAMLYHTKAVCRGAKNTFVVFDMPFGSYIDKEIALANAIRVYRETGADAIKIEGGAEKREIVTLLTQNGIAVMGHIGLMPQSVRAEGGYKIKGKDTASTNKLIEDAKAIEAAGAFALVIEGVKKEGAAEISAAVSIPTIGIGSGSGTDGQVLVFSDMLGLYDKLSPKFVRRYVEGKNIIKDALAQYREDVQSGNFPSDEESY